MENQIVHSPLPVPQPKNWLVESVLATIFCLPLGIVALIYAAKVNRYYAAGKYDMAEKASSDAGKWTRMSFFTVIGLVVFYFVLVYLDVVDGVLDYIKNR